jgi:predicted DNA-binding antitoxin AbrB/MazE fold protein
MRTIRAVFRDGNIHPLEPVDLPENAQLRIALLDSDDLPTDALAKLARAGEAFDFLDDAREDIYSESDGEPI